MNKEKETITGSFIKVGKVDRKGRRTTSVEMDMADAMFSEFPSNVREFLETPKEELVKYWTRENGEKIPVRFCIGLEVSSIGMWGKKMEAPSGVPFVRLHAHKPIHATISKGEISMIREKNRESSKIYKALKKELRRKKSNK